MKQFVLFMLALVMQTTGTFVTSAEGTEKPTFTIMAPQTNYVRDLATNDYFLWVEEQTGVHIQWRTADEAVIGERVNLALTSRELPDAFLFCDLDNTQQMQYGAEGVFVNLAPYIESRGTYIKAAYEANDLMPGAITMPDGGIYALAGINTCYHCIYCGRAWINQTWLDNLNLSMPTTTQELADVLRAFKEEDANGNGDPNDEIPFMACGDTWRASAYDYLMEAFTYNDFRDRMMMTDEGEVVFVANTEAWRNGLEYIRSLIVEELIDPASLYQTAAECQVISGGDVANVGVAPAMSYWTTLSNHLDQYVAMPPIEGPDGTRNAFVRQDTGYVNGQFAITSACKDVETLFDWADFQFSDEATYFSSWGIEGIGWSAPQEGDIGVNGEPALYRTYNVLSEGEVGNSSAPNIALANRTAEFRLGQAVTGDDDSEYRLYIAAKEYARYASDNYLPALIYTEEEASRIAILKTQVNDYVNEMTAAFLNGDIDIDDGWDAYVAEFDALGLEEYLSINQAAYDRVYEK